MIAVAKGLLDYVKKLIDMGANINAQTPSNANALTYAVRGGDMSIVNYLIEHGADHTIVDSNKNNLLHIACASGHVPVIELLLGKGLSLDATNEQGFVPAALAIKNSHLKAFEFIYNLEEDAEKKRFNYFLAWRLAGEYGLLDVARFLVGTIASKELATGKKLAWSMAAEHGQDAVLTWMLDEGMDIDTRINTNEQTALMVASTVKRASTITLLLQRGANPDLVDINGKKAVELTDDEEIKKLFTR
jgi:ankyrin repeat protein